MSYLLRTGYCCYYWFMCYRHVLLTVDKMPKHAVEILVEFVVHNISHQSSFQHQQTKETCGLCNNKHSAYHYCLCATHT